MADYILCGNAEPDAGGFLETPRDVAVLGENVEAAGKSNSTNLG